VVLGSNNANRAVRVVGPILDLAAHADKGTGAMAAGA
jgi:hypothetical protein